jgi:DNA adenine methylase
MRGRHILSNSLKISTENDNSNNTARPILKWAGGKTQMLEDIIPKMPTKYGRYIETALKK